MTTYRVLICDTRTGAVLDELPFSSFSLAVTVDWARGDSLTVNVPLLGARHQSRGRIVGLRNEPWKRSLCLLRGNRALWAGPMISVDWSQTSFNLTCAGLPKLLDKRFVFSSEATEKTVSADARDAIGWLLWWAISPYEESGDVRYRLPLTNATIAGGTPAIKRTWYGRDFATVYESVKKVTEEDGAPDVRLVTEIDAEQQSILWRATYGDPYLGSYGPSVDWDYPANVKTLSGSTDGTNIITRGYVMGDGQQDERIVASAENSLASDGYPWMDGADRNATSVRSFDVARALADSFARANSVPAEAWEVTVHPDHPNFDKLTLGDNNTFRVNGHPIIENGEYLRRVTGYTLTQDSLSLETVPPLEGDYS